MKHPVVGSALVLLLTGLLLAQPGQPLPAIEPASTAVQKGAVGELGSSAHEQRVMKSSYCSTCHPDIYAEHEQNTHGRAFTDEEVRLGTGRFSQADCIICHTPRPVFETGIGMNPIRRHHDLEEGNSCMTCHWTPKVDYSKFVGGQECKTAFDPRVGTVEACASCHRNHGTPYQWEQSPNGKPAGRVCIDCHMPIVERPVAVGESPRDVHSHVFPASRSESQLQRAYAYEAKINGDEVVVTVTNKGAGHNFPTELKQRAVESLVVVKDLQGKEIARSRMIFRDPYKRPYGLTLEVNTQIPSGQSREHRVPIGVAAGTIECELHYKLYYPIEDFHPELSRLLEARRLPFRGITPSAKPVESAPDVAIVTPEGISAETASPADLIDYARPKINKVDVDIPQGSTDADIAHLIELFQFPVLQANAEARKRLVQIGAPAIPRLVAALGSWDNKTFNQAMTVLEQLGAQAGPALLAATKDDALYVRIHACELLSRLGWKGEGSALVDSLEASLVRPAALDRAQAALTLGDLGQSSAIPDLRRLLADRDPDVVRGAAKSLGKLGAKDAIPDLKAALAAAPWIETRRDLADVLGRLGDSSGIPILLAGLDESDDLIRESIFETFFGLTGMHAGYDPLAPRDQRLEALSHLQAWWARSGGDERLQHPVKVPILVMAEVKKAVEAFAGGDGTTPAGDDEKLRARFLELGAQAVPMLANMGLKYPPGYATKRAAICKMLGEIGLPSAVPALQSTLRDPVVSVGAWACWALDRIGDKSALPAVQRWHQRLLSLDARGAIPPSAGAADSLLAQAAAARFRFGDARAEPDLVALLLSDVLEARRTAIEALRGVYGDDLVYDSEASAEARRAAVERWQSGK